MAVPAVAAAVEAPSTADLAVLVAVSAAERAVPVSSSAKLRSLFMTLSNVPVSSGFFGMGRSSLGYTAIIIIWRRFRSCSPIGTAVR